MTHKHYNLAFATACVVLALCVTTHTVKAGQTGKGPVKVFILAGQSNMEGQGVVDLDDEQDYNGGRGNLEHVMQDPAKAHLYKHLKGDDGNWAVRDEVWVWYKTENEGVKKGGLTLGYTPYPGKHHFGPELQFGHVLGDLLDNQVLLIKTAWGGKSLYQDFRPPSSGGEVGPCYTRMLEEIHDALANMKKHFPDYDGRGYEVAGFVWFQGWNDMINNAAVLEYEENLANLIKDVRKEFRVPNLPVAIGETGNCDNIAFRKAQAAVAQRAEFKGSVAFVETEQFRRPANESPNVGHGHHWYGNAESYFLIGNALGEAMKRLLKAPYTDENADPPKPRSRTIRDVEGWIVRVDERLLVPPNEELGLRALKLLEAKLADIKYVMAEEPLVRLQSVPIVLDLTHGKLRVMQYHPDADWLEVNGYSTDLVKCVHIPEAADLPTPRNINEQPWVVLHELAHAYHDQALGFDEPRIREAYERFKRSGHGDSVLLYDGNRVRHYALTDHKEFFAEMTEAYFGMDDFFPFNRAELMTAEPEIFELLRTIWEPVQPAGAAVHPKSPKDTDRSRWGLRLRGAPGTDPSVRHYRAEFLPRSLA